MIRPRYKGERGGTLTMSMKKNIPEPKHKDWKLTTCPQCGQAVLGKRTGTTVLEKGQNPESTLYRMRVRREKMSSFTLITTGLITGFILGKAVLILHYAIKIKQEEEKKYDRDRKDTQSNEKGDSGLYSVPPERGAESDVSGGGDNT